jgi:hypothetical protein
VSDVVILVVAAGFALMGAYALAAPAAILAPFGVAIETPDARSEVRAVYGGFGLAVAGVLGWAAASSGDLREGVVVAVAIALAGMAFGRLASRAFERPAGFYPVWAFFWIEVASAAALLAAA